MKWQWRRLQNKNPSLASSKRGRTGPGPLWIHSGNRAAYSKGQEDITAPFLCKLLTSQTLHFQRYLCYKQKQREISLKEEQILKITALYFLILHSHANFCWYNPSKTSSNTPMRNFMLYLFFFFFCQIKWTLVVLFYVLAILATWSCLKFAPC